MHIRLSRYLSLALSLSFSATGHSQSTSPTTGKAAPEPMNHSYVKLFTLVGWGPVVDPDEKQLRFIADNYMWLNGHSGSWYKGVQAWEYFAGPSAGKNAEGKTIGQRLKEMNPELILSSYRSSQHTNQHSLTEGPEVERNIPLAIAVWDTDMKLVKPLSAADEVILLTPFKNIPEGMPAHYPWKASNSDEEYSATNKKYVTWLRLGDEIIRINKVEAAEDGNIRMQVKRGIWGTKAAEHGTDSIVLQPNYYGGHGKNKKEYYLSGRPDSPSPEPGLYYNMIMNSPVFWEWLGDKCEEIINEGYDGPWLDEAVSNWIIYCNAYGEGIPGHYDIEKKQYDTNDTYLVHQQQKIDYLFKRFPKARFYVNWIFPKYYWTQGNVKRLFSGEGGYHPISGGSIEMYANRNYMDWHELMRMQIDMRDNNYTFNAWAKFNGTGGDWDMTDQYKLYAYATYLMLHEPGAPNCFGGLWHNTSKESKYWSFEPPSIVYWDLGKPMITYKSIEEAEMKDNPKVYARPFEKGMIVVNPDLKETRTVKLDDELYDVTRKQWVGEVTLLPESAALLLKQ